jgi:hypothetical protein
LFTRALLVNYILKINLKFGQISAYLRLFGLRIVLMGLVTSVWYIGAIVNNALKNISRQEFTDDFVVHFLLIL